MPPDTSATSTLRTPTFWQNLALAFCLLFGLALIPQIQVAGDGMWFWYAILWQQGHRFYADLHLPLQPLYPLLIAAIIRLFGQSWIAAKLLAAATMLAFAFTLRGIVRVYPGSDLQRAVALCFAFVMPLLFEASRFDDYHVLTDITTALCVFLLIHRVRILASAHLLLNTICLGTLCALAMVSRLNDGGLLLLSTAVVLALQPASRRWLHLLALTLAAALVTVAVVALTGDTLASWADNSIFRAAGAKGGSGKVLLAPARLLWDAFQEFFTFRGYAILDGYLALLGAAVLFLDRRRQHARPLLLPSLLLAVAILLLLPLAHHWSFVELPAAVELPAVFALAAAGVFLLVRALIHLRSAVALTQPATDTAPLAANPYALLLFLPLGQLISGAMSSGGLPLPLTSPLGMALFLLPISLPRLAATARSRLLYTTVLAAMAFSCFAYKWENPFIWHSYRAAPLFTKREFYRHPVYGPMVIETELLNFVEPICTRAHLTPGAEILSLPFPYPNYFCATPPWHGYVETFFDISTRQTINHLLDDLRAAPPGTIVYQRQIRNLEVHEQIYNSGHPLPQRTLDDYIGSQLRAGNWTVLHQQCIGHSDWITIQTRAQKPTEPLQWSSYRCGK